MPVTLAFSGYRLPEMHGHVFIGLRGRPAQRWHDSRACRDEASGLLKSKAFVESVCQHMADPASGKQQRLSLIRVLGSDLLQQPASTSDRDLARAIGEFCALTPWTATSPRGWRQIVSDFCTEPRSTSAS